MLLFFFCSHFIPRSSSTLSDGIFVRYEFFNFFFCILFMCMFLFILCESLTFLYLFYSDTEASVMLSNSWLYHYYSVQSKIQMGFSYEGSSSGTSPRIPQTTNSFYPYQAQHYQMHQLHQSPSPYDLPQHHLHGHHHYDYSPPVSNNDIINHNNNNNNSPTSLKESTTTTTTSTALMPVDYSQQHSMDAKLSPAHENNNNSSGSSRGEKIVTTEDYSSEQPSRKKATAIGDDKSNKLQNHDNKSKLSKVDYKSVRISNKKYTFKRIESLQISDSTPAIPTSTTTSLSAIENDEISQVPLPPRAHIYENHNEHVIMEMEHRDGQMLYLNSSIHTARSRMSKSFSSSLPLLPPPHHLEAVSNPSAHHSSSVNGGVEIEQWNPSPTWSENNIQKVPDIMHQQLSPYLITTPPTPMSASYIPHTSSFTFDWTPEHHYVPSVGGMHDDRNIMELTSSARCYYNRPQLMSIDDSSHKDEEMIVRNS